MFMAIGMQPKSWINHMHNKLQLYTQKRRSTLSSVEIGRELTAFKDNLRKYPKFLKLI